MRKISNGQNYYKTLVRKITYQAIVIKVVAKEMLQQASAYNFTKSNTSLQMSFTFVKIVQIVPNRAKRPIYEH